MLIAGDISGIQRYLFDVAHEGGGQARRLRARSFTVQLQAECALERVLRACRWNEGNVVFCSAGKFLIDGPSTSPETIDEVRSEARGINRHLLAEGGNLHFSLAVVEDSEPFSEGYGRVMNRLQRAKARAWAEIAATAGEWHCESLVLDSLDTPCALCSRGRASVEEADPDSGNPRSVCMRCHQDLEMGKQLARARWAAVGGVVSGPFDVAGFGLALTSDPPQGAAFTVFIGDHTGAAPAAAPAGARRLARHIPVDEGGRPVEFVALAARARGDALLGVLKADADSLGLAIHDLLQAQTGATALARFSAELDGFFSEELDRELARPPWSSLYTVFAGGDDLMLVGPWDIVIDFAGHMRSRFDQRFGKRGLTISAGVAIVKPKRPIRFAAESAEGLLESAKTEVALGAGEPKDQVAAFGQVWKWRDHEVIVGAAKRLAEWVDRGIAQRGWLHTLLTLAESRQCGDVRATARLAYFVARNLPKWNDRAPEKGALREWADRLIVDFDEMRTPTVRYLPAIVRYALTATRRGQQEDR